MKIRAYKEFHTNVKGLPEGEYLTETMYSDRAVWKVLSKTAKTMTVVEVHVKKDPEFKPVFHAGGFVAHCSNQSDQTWLFDHVTDHQKTVRLKKSKYSGSDLHWGDKHGATFVANGAVHFHEYNF